MSFGELEGFPVALIAQEHPELARRLADLEDSDFAWPGGESRREFHERVRATFEAILTYYPRHAVIVVAHSGVIGSFLAQLRGLRLSDPRTFNVANCGLTQLEITARHTWIHRLNDVTHLGLLQSPRFGP
jgi:broad specificity phosphatase PhoE